MSYSTFEAACELFPQIFQPLETDIFSRRLTKEEMIFLILTPVSFCDIVFFNSLFRKGLARHVLKFHEWLASLEVRSSMVHRSDDFLSIFCVDIAEYCDLESPVVFS